MGAFTLSVILVAAAVCCSEAAILKGRSANVASATANRKMRNGPPSEFASFAVPQATQGALFDADAAYFIALCSSRTNNGNSLKGYTFAKDIAVDASSAFTFAVVLPEGKTPENLKVTAPDGSALDLEANAQEVRMQCRD
jgi:hypothetical protein